MALRAFKVTPVGIPDQGELCRPGGVPKQAAAPQRPRAKRASVPQPSRLGPGLVDKVWRGGLGRGGASRRVSLQALCRLQERIGDYACGLSLLPVPGRQGDCAGRSRKCLSRLEPVAAREIRKGSGRCLSPKRAPSAPIRVGQGCHPPASGSRADADPARPLEPWPTQWATQPNLTYSCLI